MPETTGQPITRRNYLKSLLTVIIAGVGVAIGYGLRELTGSPTETPTLTQTITQTATQTTTQTVTETRTETQPVTQTVNQTVTEKTTVTPPGNTITQTTSQTLTQTKTETATKTVTEGGTTVTQTVTQTSTAPGTTTTPSAPGTKSYKIDVNMKTCQGIAYCGKCIGTDPDHFTPSPISTSSVVGGTTSGDRSTGYFTDDKIANAKLAEQGCPSLSIKVTET